MGILILILLILGLACLVIAAFNLAGGRLNFLALGLALWLAAEIIPHLADL